MACAGRRAAVAGGLLGRGRLPRLGDGVRCTADHHHFPVRKPEVLVPRAAGVRHGRHRPVLWIGFVPCGVMPTAGQLECDDRGRQLGHTCVGRYVRHAAGSDCGICSGRLVG